MKRFLAHFKQRGEGCDYTIGCAHALREIEAESIEAAIGALANDYMAVDGDHRYPLSDRHERELKSVVVYEVAQERPLPLVDLRNARAQREHEAKAASSEQHDRAEFERLQRKYGGKTA